MCDYCGHAGIHAIVMALDGAGPLGCDQCFVCSNTQLSLALPTKFGRAHIQSLRAIRDCLPEEDLDEASSQEGLSDEGWHSRFVPRSKASSRYSTRMERLGYPITSVPPWEAFSETVFLAEDLGLVARDPGIATGGQLPQELPWSVSLTAKGRQVLLSVGWGGPA
jgi:hypothetical protein